MKTTKIIYWTSTILFAGLMIFSAVPNVMQEPEAVQFITHLGYPAYFIPMIGVAKILGAIAILIPGFNRIKEWAYAGLMFDLLAALYSLIAVDGWQTSMLAMLFFIGAGVLSYVYHHKYVAAAK